ncbi:MAG TPA: methyltransferase domain-containing protein [Gammaproteobacteria bacterium]|jgi:malonyl-CoA O-methyltransferase
MTTLRPELALPGKHASRAGFARAAPRFETACFVHDWTRARLLERLPLLRVEPSVLVDLGSATGRGAAALARRFAGARVLALDTSLAMLAVAERARAERVVPIVGDAERLPLASRSVSLVLANLVLPWCRPDAVFHELARVLAPGGALMFATLGPDSLREVRRAWASVDSGIHVHAAFDMHDLGDAAAAAGLAEPVLDVERMTLKYRDVADLVRDLRASGAANTAGGRRRTLTGRQRWQAFAAALHSAKQGERFDVTIEVIFGQAWGGGAPARAAAEVVVPLGRVGRRRALKEP